MSITSTFSPHPDMIVYSVKEFAIYKKKVTYLLKHGQLSFLNFHITREITTVCFEVQKLCINFTIERKKSKWSPSQNSR